MFVIEALLNTYNYYICQPVRGAGRGGACSVPVSGCVRVPSPAAALRCDAHAAVAGASASFQESAWVLRHVLGTDVGEGRTSYTFKAYMYWVF